MFPRTIGYSFKNYNIHLRIRFTSARRYIFSSCQKWILEQVKRKDSYSSYGTKKAALDNFWNEFLNELNESPPIDSGVHLYHTDVFRMLIDAKNNSYSSFIELQQEIENLTMGYDQESLYRTAPYLMSQLISNELPTAKDSLLNLLEGDDLDVIYSLRGEYSLETISIYTLGLVFSSVKESSVVKLSTLVDQLDSAVRFQSKIERSHQNILSKKEEDKDKGLPPSGDGKRKKKARRFDIGVNLVEFLVSRGLIHISTDVDSKAVLPIKGYYPKNCYVMCNFDFSVLPMKLNLPMVFPPAKWHIDRERYEDIGNKPYMDAKEFVTLSDITGGYLCNHTAEMYNRFKVLTTRNLKYFNVYMTMDQFYERREIMNGLQEQRFTVDSNLLSFIKEERSSLEKAGLLMPSKLASINMTTACLRLREYYFHSASLKKNARLEDLLSEFQKRVQRARYEDFVIRLASAYEGYTFYLPAFMDFRGRIYRAGVLHFHERDLSKSLIQFGGREYPNTPLCRDLYSDLTRAAAFKYQKFTSNQEASQWYKLNKQKWDNKPGALIQFAAGASDPFQFMSKVLSMGSVIPYELCQQPMSQDASASAYQIISYLLLNIEMAKLTNLIPTDEGFIQDMYKTLLEELRLFLKDQFSDNMMAIINEFMSRKLVKSIFMPLVYGKTLISINNDIRLAFGSYIDYKDCMKLSKLIHQFFSTKFPDIVNLMKLINKIAWFCSALNKPVLYFTDYYLTLQDYTCSINENIQVYNRITKKRHRVTLRIPTDKKDKRKTQVSTFANFIHQKDAFISMNLVNELLGRNAPVYTVHDNFITSLPFVKEVPKIYTKTFIGLGPPIQFINHFIVVNLLSERSYLDSSDEKPLYLNDNISIDALKSLLEENKGGPIHWVMNPIPLEHLKYILEWNIPENSQSSERNKLISKADEIVQYYDFYVRNVCGRDVNDVEKAGRSHSVKWNKFKKLIRGWDGEENNYSLHY